MSSQSNISILAGTPANDEATPSSSPCCSCSASAPSSTKLPATSTAFTCLLSLKILRIPLCTTSPTSSSIRLHIIVHAAAVVATQTSHSPWTSNAAGRCRQAHRCSRTWGCSGQVTKGSKRLTAAVTVHVDVMRSSLLLLSLLKSRSSVSATASDVRAMRFSSSNTHDSVVAFLWLMRGM